MNSRDHSSSLFRSASCSETLCSAASFRMYSMIFMEQDSLLDCGEFAAVKLIEEIGNSASSLPMVKARGWRHDELASSVDLEAFRTIGEGGIAAKFGATVWWQESRS